MVIELTKRKTGELGNGLFSLQRKASQMVECQFRDKHSVKIQSKPSSG